MPAHPAEYPWSAMFLDYLSGSRLQFEVNNEAHRFIRPECILHDKRGLLDE